MNYENYTMINKLNGDLIPGKSPWRKDYPSNQGGFFMNEQQYMEDRLWNFIDGLTGKDQKAEIEELIATNLEWQTKYHELLGIHESLHLTELDAPSMRFTKNVMEEIARHKVAPAAKNYINNKIIWGIGSFFVTLFIGFLIYGLSQTRWTNEGSRSFLPSMRFSEKVDWSKLLNNGYTNIFLMVNVVLGLVLLDMYLHRKKERISNKGA